MPEIKPCTILVSNPAFRQGVGGRDDYLVPLLQGLARCGHRLVLSCDEAEDAGIDGAELVPRRPCPAAPGPFWRCQQLLVARHLERELRRLRSRRPDVVLTSGLVDVWAARRALPRVPVVLIPNSLVASADAASYFTSPVSRAIAGGLAGAAQRYALTRATRIVAFSHAAMAVWRRLAPTPIDRFLVSPPGLDLERFAPRPRDEGLLKDIGIPSGAGVLVAVGRLVPLKGLDFALRALRPLLLTTPTYLVLAGDGPERPALERTATEAGVCNRVRFTGFRTDVERLLSIAHVFVHPSRIEYFPLVLLQALGAGVPIVCRRAAPPAVINILHAIVEEGRTGFLASTEGQFVERVGWLLAEPERRAEMSRRAREVAVARYSWAEHTAAVDSVVRGAADASGASGLAARWTGRRWRPGP